MPRKCKFCSICPFCNGTKTFHWHHGTGKYDHKFASASQTHNGNLYFYDDGTVECELCHQRDNIINWSFDCGEHQNLYYGVSSMEVYRMLYSMKNMGGVDEDFIDNALDTII